MFNFYQNIWECLIKLICFKKQKSYLIQINIINIFNTLKKLSKFTQLKQCPPPPPSDVTTTRRLEWAWLFELSSPQNNSSLLSVADLVHFLCEIQVCVYFILSLKSLLCFKSFYLMQNSIQRRNSTPKGESRLSFCVIETLCINRTLFLMIINIINLDDKMSSELSLFVYWQVMESVARSIFRLWVKCRTPEWSSKFIHRARVRLPQDDQRWSGGYWITDWLITLELGYLNV